MCVCNAGLLEDRCQRSRGIADYNAGCAIAGPKVVAAIASGSTRDRPYPMPFSVPDEVAVLQPCATNLLTPRIENWWARRSRKTAQRRIIRLETRLSKLQQELESLNGLIRLNLFALPRILRLLTVLLMTMLVVMLLVSLVLLNKGLTNVERAEIVLICAILCIGNFFTSRSPTVASTTITMQPILKSTKLAL